MSHDAVKWIAVHFCEVCGAHVHEEAETYPDLDDGHVHSWYVEGLSLQPCDTCRLIVCASCRDDGFCCDRRAAIEMEGLPERPNTGELF